jgi:hypothetical protein
MSFESTEEKLQMIQRRLRVVKWLSTTPVLGVCTLCSREFKVPMSALRRTAEAQASLQEQFDRHKCEPDDLTGEICTRWNERESTWRKSGSCQSRGTSQSRS